MRRCVADAPRAPALVDELGVTDPTALAALEQAGLIVETSGRQWGRQYLARDVLRAIEMPSDAGHELGEGQHRNA